ncbi:MAG: YtxH domain-containing protein [Parabacteroides sp.]|nr:YtxH domain-containing protein [Parabacteroides sp.]
MSTVKVIAGVIAGAATGALLGILFAPAQGSATRRSIYRMGEQRMYALKNKFSDMIDGITDKLTNVKGDVKDLIHEAELTAKKVEKDLMSPNK